MILDFNPHVGFARNSRRGCRASQLGQRIQQKTASEKNQQPHESFLGQLGSSFASARDLPPQPLPGNSIRHVRLQLQVNLSGQVAAHF